MNLFEVAREIAARLTSIFLRDEHGRRPVYGGTDKFQTDPRWRDYILFYEYFHGDNGRVSAQVTKPDGRALSLGLCGCFRSPRPSNSSNWAKEPVSRKGSVPWPDVARHRRARGLRDHSDSSGRIRIQNS
jgi:hypothetical protein